MARIKSRILILTLFILFFCSPTALAIPWYGKVIDKETGLPIKGVVVVRSWKKNVWTISGATSTISSIEEGITDEKGKFAVPGRLHAFIIPWLPLLPQVQENDSLIYKPGYKLVKTKGMSFTVLFERLPTLKKVRSEELEKARQENALLDVYKTIHTKLLKEIIEREEEFVSVPSIGRNSQLVGVGGGVAPAIAQRNPYLEPIPSTKEDQAVVKMVKTLSSRSKKLSSNDIDILVKAWTNGKLPWVTRYKAGEILGTSENPKAITALGKIVTNINVESQVRDRSGDWLQRSKNPEAIDILGKVLTDQGLPQVIRLNAIRHLEDSKNPRAVDYLLKVQKDNKDMIIKGRAVSALKTFKDPRTADVMTKLLNEDDPNLKEVAIMVLAGIGEPGADSLLKFLSNPENKITTAQAAMAYGLMNDPRAIDPLIALLDTDEFRSSSNVINHVFAGLGKYQDPRITSALINALVNPKNVKIRNQIYYAIVKAGAPAAVALHEALHNQDPEIRLLVVRSLGAIKNPDSQEPLLESLKDPDPTIRRETIYALSGFKMPQLAEPLINMWNDENKEVRSAVTFSLEILGVLSVNALIDTLKHPNPYFRWRAAAILGKLKSSDSEEPLIQLLDDNEADVRWTAIASLGEIGSQQAVEKLVPFCNDRDSGLKEIAKSSLQKINGTSVCP